MEHIEHSSFYGYPIYNQIELERPLNIFLRSPKGKFLWWASTLSRMAFAPYKYFYEAFNFKNRDPWFRENVEYCFPKVFNSILLVAVLSILIAFPLGHASFVDGTMKIKILPILRWFLMIYSILLVFSHGFWELFKYYRSLTFPERFEEYRFDTIEFIKVFIYSAVLTMISNHIAILYLN